MAKIYFNYIFIFFFIFLYSILHLAQLILILLIYVTLPCTSSKLMHNTSLLYFIVALLYIAQVYERCIPGVAKVSTAVDWSTITILTK